MNQYQFQSKYPGCIRMSLEVAAAELEVAWQRDGWGGYQIVAIEIDGVVADPTAEQEKSIDEKISVCIRSDS